MKFFTEKIAEKISAELKEEARHQAEQEARDNGQVENKPKRIARFCIQEKIYRGIPRPCSPLAYFVLADRGDNEVWDIWTKIQLLKQEYPFGGDDYQKEYNLLKKELPIACFHAQAFANDGRRTNENAIPNGLVMSDFDHCDGKKIWQDMKDRGVVEENRIVLAYETPSGGLRLVAERKWDESIPMAQKRLAIAANAEYDQCVCDLARASYITPEMLGIDFEGLTFESEEEARRIGEHFAQIDKAEKRASFSRNIPRACQKDSDEATGVALELKDQKEIVPVVRSLVDALTIAGTPEVGMRHDTYNTLGAYVAPLVDFDPRRLFAVLPRWKDDDERWAQCQYVCEHTDRYARTPLIVAIAQKKQN